MATPRGSQIDAISVSLGLNLSQLQTDIRTARTELETLATGRKTQIPVTLNLTQFNTNMRKAAQSLRTDLLNSVRFVNEQGIVLNPKFTVSGAAVRKMRTDINRQLRDMARQGAGGDIQAVEIPVTARMTKTDAKSMLGGIQDALAAQPPVKIAVDWYWVNGPPPGNLSVPVTPSGGGPGPAGGGAAPAGGGGRPAGGGGRPAADGHDHQSRKTVIVRHAHAHCESGNLRIVPLNGKCDGCGSYNAEVVAAVGVLPDILAVHDQVFPKRLL